MKQILFLAIAALFFHSVQAQIKFNEYSLHYYSDDANCPSLVTAVKEMPVGHSPATLPKTNTLFTKHPEGNHRVGHFYASFTYDTSLVHFFASSIAIKDVNKRYIRSWVKEEGGYLLLEDKTQVPVARSRKEELKQLLK